VPEVRYGSLPFQESIDFFRNKLNISTERWNDVWRNGHNNGFMIAGAMKDDLLNDFRKMVDSAISEGKSIGWLKKNFKEIRAKHGWDHTGSSAWRSRVIYDTNMRQSYNAGRYEQLQHFDVWEYQHGDSLHPRELHLSWHTLRLPKTDKFWLTHFPQNGWGCKCKVRGRTKAWLARHGHVIDLAPKDGSWEWVDKVTGEAHVIPKGIDPGFDYAPRKQAVSKNLKQLADKKAKPFTPPPRVAKTAFSTVPGADVHSLNKVLNELKTTSAAPEIALLEKFLTQHETKTLFLQQKEMNPKAIAATKVVNDIEAYLGKHPRYSTISLFTDRGYLRAEGFTSSAFEHVVLKGIGKLSKVDFNEVKHAIQAGILLKEANKSALTFSEILKQHGLNGENGAMLTNWIHEIGHQIHFKAGSPYKPLFKTATSGSTITRYAQQNHYEWHAEMFVAWLLDRKALANWNEEITAYMDNLVNNAINKGNK